jgi:hypothetical protein
MISTIRLAAERWDFTALSLADCIRFQSLPGISNPGLNV